MPARGPGDAAARSSNAEFAPQWHEVRQGQVRQLDQAAAVDMGVNLRGGDIRVTEQQLQGPQIRPALEQMGREAVSERMAACRLRDARPTDRLLHLTLQHGFVQVMPAPLANKRKKAYD